MSHLRVSALGCLALAAFTVGLWPAHVAAQTLTSAAAQTVSLQDDVVEQVLQRGWWDESGALSEAEMGSLVERWGDDVAFAYTDRSFDVVEDSALSAAPLLAQSALKQLELAGGPTTLLLIAGDDAGGASTSFPYPNVVLALQDFDRDNVEDSFDQAASTLLDLGNTVAQDSLAQGGFFDSAALFVALGGVTVVLALASVRSARKKRARQTHTAHARGDTKYEIQEMSNLILDLEPRVTIANDPALKARYVDASKTYSEVLEHADLVETGHEVADLLLEIAQARWKLDVIDAELDGRAPPPEPFRRDTAGSAWDSTRGGGVDRFDD